MVKKRIARLWTAMVCVIFAALYAAVAVNVWYQTADNVNATRFALDIDSYAIAAGESLAENEGDDGNVYMEIVDEYNPAKPNRDFGNARASALIIAREPNDHRSYSEYEILATTADAYAANGETEHAENYPAAQELLEWYMGKEFAPEFYPTYIELRGAYGLVRSVDWGVVEEYEDGSAMVLVTAQVYSNPKYTLFQCGPYLGVLFLLFAAGAAVIVTTGKKFLQST